MNRSYEVYGSAESRREIEYSLLDILEIQGRNRSYEKRYGGDFSKALSGYSCDNASQQEITDYMDWKNLTQELSARDAVVRQNPVGIQRIEVSETRWGSHFAPQSVE